MSGLVVDASVGLKWFVPELHATDARRLQSPTYSLHVPTLFDVELGNILWKKIQRRELSVEEAKAIVAQLPHLPVTRHPEEALLAAAFDLAIQTGRTVYDSLYLALAVELGEKLATADLRFFNALRGTIWAAHLVWIEDVP